MLSKVANLSDKKLSRFLTDSLLVPAISTISVFFFFALDPIRCWAEHKGEEKEYCERTLDGQAGEKDEGRSTVRP